MTKKNVGLNYKTAIKIVAKEWNLSVSELERIAEETSKKSDSLLTHLTEAEKNAWPELPERQIKHFNRCDSCTISILKRQKKDLKNVIPKFNIGTPA